MIIILIANIILLKYIFLYLFYILSKKVFINLLFYIIPIRYLDNNTHKHLLFTTE